MVHMRALKWIGGVVLVLFAAIALFFAFGLSTLRGPIADAVTKATGRELVIGGGIRPVWSWVHPRIRIEGVTFANADWGKADYLLNANAVEASISVLPLLAGRVVLPEVHLEGAELALERDAGGRRNWLLKDEDNPKEESRFFVKLLTVDDSRVTWDDATSDTRVEADLSTDETGVIFEAQGKWNGMKLKGAGHAGHVAHLDMGQVPRRQQVEVLGLHPGRGIGQDHLDGRCIAASVSPSSPAVCDTDQSKAAPSPPVVHDT